MIILPSHYFGSVEYWARLVAAGDDAVIDIGENYVKRTERNRTTIMTSNGLMQLSVQLAHANRPRQPMRSMRVDYSKRWQHQHAIAIESAYKRSPYYDYYGDRFAHLFNREWRYLVDINMATLEGVCSILKIGVPRISESYITATEGDVDLRGKLITPSSTFMPYIQVFSDREPFAPNISIYDLIMCEGPSAISYLKSVNIK